MKKQLFTMILAGLFLGGLAAIAVLNYFSTSNAVTGTVMVNDIAKLAQIFDRINKTCRIISFDYQKNPINFLNIKSFVSSEVGPMNLAYPDKWEGPYVQDNPTVQGKEYMVVKTYDGYFITPGEEVELPNDKVIGKDIILDENADIPALLQNDLLYQGKPLAAAITQIKSSVDAALIGLSE